MYALTVVLLLTALHPAAGNEGVMKIDAEAPAGLFLLGEPIRFSVPGDASSYRVTDYDDAEASRGEIRGGKVQLEPLPCGYYELHVSAGANQATTSFGILPRPQPAKAARIAVDGATAWLSKADQWPAIAKMLRRAGIGWVRERLSWGQVQPQAEALKWGKYDTVPSAFAEQGVKVYQIFHDTPAWTRPGKKDTRNPDDLRTVYRFAKAAAARFAGRIQAWEVWNEPDIGFWPDLSDRFAGVQKAAYLGLKAGAPEVVVLMGSLCRGPSAFADHFFDSGIADYFDVFNFHLYAGPEKYPTLIRRYIELARRYGVDTRPIWLTEAGIRLKAVGEDVTRADRVRQAEFVPPSIVMSLAAGVDRHFFFVLPHYIERGVQFGLLHRDLSPRPAMVALATMVNVLGEADYLGRVRKTPDGVEAHVFDSGRQRVAVVWSDKPRALEMLIASDKVDIIDLVGRRTQATPKSRRLRLEVRPAAQYVVGVVTPPLLRLTVPRRPPGAMPENDPSPVVVRGYVKDLPMDKDADRYVLGPGKVFDYEIEACNFDESAPHTVTLALGLPQDWSALPATWTGRLAPMGRQVVPVKIGPGPPGTVAQTVWLRGEADGRTIAPSLAVFACDLTKVTPTRRLPLCGAGPTGWQRNVSGNGTMEIAAGEDGAVRFAIRFAKPGDRWAYPSVVFNPPKDLSAFLGIAFEYRCGADDPDTSVRMQLCEPSGTSYLTKAGFKAEKQWRRVVVQFAEMMYGSYSPPDANGRLDPDRIARLMIGCNTRRNAVTLEVRNIEAVRFDEAKP